MESGRLENESAASLCRRLGAESRTGCLHLIGESEGEELNADLYVREGRVYTATAPGGRTRLGDRLVGGGDLTAEQLEEALRAQRDDRDAPRLGELLVSSGLVSRERLREVIREQIVDSVVVPLGWTSGSWWFADGESVPEDIPLGLGMQDTLMEAARRLGQLEVIQAHLGPMDTIVDFASGGEESRLALKPDEWAMLTHIDGRTTVAGIADRAGYTQMETARILHGLLSAGVVVRKGRATDPVPDPASQPEPMVLPRRPARPGRRSAQLAHDPPRPPVPPGADVTYLDLLEGLAESGGLPLGPVRPGEHPQPTPPPGREAPVGRDDTRRGGVRGRFRRG